MSDLLLIVVGALAFVSIAAVGLVFAGAGSGSALSEIIITRGLNMMPSSATFSPA